MRYFQQQEPMAVLSSSVLSFTRPKYSSSSSQTKPALFSSTIQRFNSLSSLNSKVHSQYLNLVFSEYKTASYRYSSWERFTEAEEVEDVSCSFEEAVELFNKREYYKCHDVLETLWNISQEPTRTLVHGILQCAVGFHHLFGQNHRGAMMELGEGLCKLRKMNFEDGPFHQFEREISAALDFIYQTQLELAACTEDLCLTMDQSERSYQLLGGYAAGQPIYRLDKGQDNFTHIFFCPESFHDSSGQFSTSIKLPILKASEDHLIQFYSSY